MGFPTRYPELPKLLLHLLFLLGHLWKLLNWLSRCLGLSDSDADLHQAAGVCLLLPVVPAELIQEVSPATRFGDLAGSESCCCAVCLSEFQPADEVRRMSDCRRFFHRHCVDRWLEHGQRTCPLCLAPLFPPEPPAARGRRKRRRRRRRREMAEEAEIRNGFVARGMASSNSLGLLAFN